MVTITDFESMTEEQITQFVLQHDAKDIVGLFMLLKQKRAIKWEDRALLQMVDKSPLTFWASDEAYNIVLWSGKCSSIYNRELLGKPFPEIMSIIERSQAMKDSLCVIRADEATVATYLADFSNYYTKDLRGQKTEFSLVTNSMQLVDDETGEKYYAEIGLPINLEITLKEFRKRQKELLVKADDFKRQIASLEVEFSADIANFSDIVSKEKKLTSTQKKELREIIRHYELEISDNLAKHESAPNLNDFLFANKEAIHSANQTIKKAIECACSNIQHSEKVTQREDPDILISDIIKNTEIVVVTFRSNIQMITSATLESNLVDKQAQRLNKFQSKRDEILRELTEMKEIVPSTPSYALTLIRKRLEEIIHQMREFVKNY